MTAFMLPIANRDGVHFTVFIALDDEALARITSYDPFDTRLEQIRQKEPWSSLELGEVVIGYVNAADLLELQQMQARGAKGSEVLAYLSRGYSYSPDRGDGNEIREL